VASGFILAGVWRLAREEMVEMMEGRMKREETTKRKRGKLKNLLI
jgi:hypothetical protein